MMDVGALIAASLADPRSWDSAVCLTGAVGPGHHTPG